MCIYNTCHHILYVITCVIMHRRFICVRIYCMCAYIIYVCVYDICDYIMYVITITYGVATVSRIDKIIGLFCKRALLKRRNSAKETYDFKGPTHRSHPMCVIMHRPFIRARIYYMSAYIIYLCVYDICDHDCTCVVMHRRCIHVRIYCMHAYIIHVCVYGIRNHNDICVLMYRHFTCVRLHYMRAYTIHVYVYNIYTRIYAHIYFIRTH